MSLTFEDLGIKTKSGTRYATTCPKCSHTRKKKNIPCLTVNNEPGNRWYKCHHPECGWSGNLDIQDKFDRVRQEANLPKNIESQFSVEVRKYIGTRGISSVTMKKAGVYENVVYKRNILCFPFWQNHTIVNVKYLNYNWTPDVKGPKWWQMKQEFGTKAIPFGMQLLSLVKEKADDKIIVTITEGEWDMLTWLELGYKNIVSVPQGAPSPKAKNFEKEFAYLSDPYVKSVFEQVDLFYLSVDADEAGKLLADHLALNLGKEKCRVIQYPSGYKDINEVYNGDIKKNLKPLGRVGVEECYTNLKSFPIKGIIRVGDVRDELMKIRTDGFTPGHGIGIPEVDHLFTVKKKLIMFVTGVPGSGKSVWVRWWLVKLIIHNTDLNFKFALFTPENRPVSREYAKIAEVLTEKSIRKDFKNGMPDELYNKALRWVERHFSIISPDRKSFESFNDKIHADKVNTLDSILHYLAYLKKTENIFGYVIDAWNKIEHEQPKNETESNFISKQLDRLLNFNEYYDLFGIVIAHPRKVDETGKNYKMPSLYDIKGSSAWKEKADIGLVIHRYKMKKVSEKDLPDDPDEDDRWQSVPNAPNVVYTEKIKFEELGHEAKIKMDLDYNRGANFFIHVPENEKAKRELDEKKSAKEDKELQNLLFNDEVEDVDFEQTDDLPF